MELFYWQLSFSVSVVLTFFAILLCILSVRKKDKRIGLTSVSFVFNYLASLLIYVPIFYNKSSGPEAIFGNIINSFQVVSLDADYSGQYELIIDNLGEGLFANAYLFQLGFLHIIIPIMSVVVAYSIIFHWLTNIKTSFASKGSKDTFVFSCASDRAVALAGDIYANLGKKALFIFMDGRKKNEVLPDKLLSMKCIFTDKDFNSFYVKPKNNKNIHFFAMCDNADTNVDSTISIVEMYQSKSAAEQKKIHVYLFSCLAETECMIDSIIKGAIDIQIVDEYKLAVYQLLDEFPLYNYNENDKCSVLIVGLDKLGVRFLKTVIWIGQLYGFELKINLIDNNISVKKSQIIEEAPELFSGAYNIEWHSVSIDSVEFDDIVVEKCFDTTYCVICGEEDSSNISAALRLRRAFLRNDPEFCKKPFIGLHINSREKHDMINNMSTAESNPSRRINYQLTPFGGENASCTYRHIVDSDLYDLAKNVHMAYEEIFSEKGIVEDIDAALAKFNVFEVNKSSNLANAMHIKYKLWGLGLTYVKADETDAQEVDFSKYVSNEEFLNKLTYVEHDRWMAFLRSEGWITADISQVEKYKQSGISGGRHNCPLLKMHPFICDFYDLPEISDKLGQIDATIYDMKLITKIPEILHDKWNISGKKYKIIKTDKQ